MHRETNGARAVLTLPAASASSGRTTCNEAQGNDVRSEKGDGRELAR